MSINYDNTVYLVNIIIYWGYITFYNYVRNTVCPIVVGVCWLSPVRLICHSRCGLYDIPTDLTNPACQWRPFVVTGKKNPDTRGFLAGLPQTSWTYFADRIGLHDDVIKWKHFLRYCPFVRGIPRSPVNSPHKGQWRGALMISLNCAWIE